MCFVLLARWIWSFPGAQQNIFWEVQRYDGWYNNLLHHGRGSVGECQVGMGVVGWGELAL